MANTGNRSFIGKILFVIGVIIILIVLAFLIIRFVPRIFSGLANVGSSVGGFFNQSEITIQANDTSLQDGDQFALSWQYSPQNPGSYSITYSCTDDVMLHIQTTDGSRRLICNNPFTLGPNASNATLAIDFDKNNAFADVPIQVLFTENGDSVTTDSGEIFVTVQNGTPSSSEGDLSGSGATIDSEPIDDTDDLPAVENVDNDDTTSSTNTNASGSSNNTNNSGTVFINTGGTSVVSSSFPADLAISNIAAGGSQVAFTVSNIGGRSTGNWIFTYTTPTNPAETFSSPLQISLAPGQAIRYTLTFGAKASGTQTVVVSVDPFNTIAENSEANNSARINLTGGSFGNGGGNNNGGFDDDDDADFIIEDLEVGRLSGSRFIEDDNVDENDDIALRFTVRNRGGETTDDWRFEIDDLPYDNDDRFESRRYNELRPGEFIEIVVELENVDEGRYDIEVLVDSEDDTDEERESNNDDSVRLEVED